MDGATPNPGRFGATKIVGLILLWLWVLALIVLPLAWALLPSAESQFAISAILAALVVA